MFEIKKVKVLLFIILVSALLSKTDASIVPTEEQIEDSIETIQGKRTFFPTLCNDQGFLYKDLELSARNIDTIAPDAFKECYNLVKINLAFDKLTTLHSKTFKYNRRLEILYLQWNKLEYLPSDIFDGLNHLKGLYLHRNSRLRTIESVLHGNLFSLKWLSIMDIGLEASSLHPREVKEKLPQLSKISFDYNLFKCSELEDFIEEFESLGVEVADLPLLINMQRCIPD